MGYSTASQCLAAELGRTLRRAQYLLRAAEVFGETKRISSGKKGEEISEKALLQVARLPTEELRREVWAEAVADGDTSTVAMRSLVDARMTEDDAQDDDSEHHAATIAQQRTTCAKRPASGTDWPARIARQVEGARRLHRRLKGRKRAADEALDHYLQVIRGKE